MHAITSGIQSILCMHVSLCMFVFVFACRSFSINVNQLNPVVRGCLLSSLCLFVFFLLKSQIIPIPCILCLGIDWPQGSHSTQVSFMHMFLQRWKGKLRFSCASKKTEGQTERDSLPGALATLLWE